MVKNGTSTSLLIAGFVVWACAIIAMPFSQTTYFMLTAAAIATFLSAVVVSLFYKQLFPQAPKA